MKVRRLFLSHASVKTFAWLVPLHIAFLWPWPLCLSGEQAGLVACPHSWQKVWLFSVVSISVNPLFLDSKTPFSLVSDSSVVASLKPEGYLGGHWRGTSANSSGQTVVAPDPGMLLL